MTSKAFQIHCSACGEDSWLKKDPIYDGFRKTGERLLCAACGHVYASEAEVPYKGASRPRVFSDKDRSKTVDVFAATEKGRNCRHCEHFVVNPFTQRCGLHFRVVEATDVCDDFSPADKDAST